MDHLAFPFVHTYPVFGWFLTAGITLVYLYFIRNKSAIIHDLPPAAPGGFWYVSSRARSVETHTYLLEISRTVGKVARLPMIPFLRLIIVADATIARMVLENPQTRRWSFGYDVFDKICGGDNCFSAEDKRHSHEFANPPRLPLPSGMLSTW